MNEALTVAAARYCEAVMQRDARLACAPALPPTAPDVLEALARYEGNLAAMGEGDRIEVPTEHLFHADMYARTVRMPAGTVITGAEIKRPTVVIVMGCADVLVGREWARIDGCSVLPASAGRKQMFVARTDVTITMIFPTEARTVEEAEAESTDEAARLLSRRQDANSVTITGE